MPIPLDCISSVSKLKNIYPLALEQFYHSYQQDFPLHGADIAFPINGTKKTALISDEWTNQSNRKSFVSFANLLTYKKTFRDSQVWKC